MTSSDLSPDSNSTLTWHAQSIDETLAILESDPETGLSESQVRDALERYGTNEIIEAPPRSSLEIFIDQFKNVMLILLIVVAIISGVLDTLDYITGDAEANAIPFKDTIAIFLIVMLNGILGYLQESRAEKALAALKGLSAPHVRVWRDSRVQEIDASQLVPGDILLLEAGQQVSADAQLLEAASLQVRESALTGEAIPSEKEAEVVLDPETALGDRANLVFAGTEVVQGRGTGVVVATGMNTELGKIARLLEGVESEDTPLQKRMTHLANVLVSGSLILVALTIGVGVIQAGWGRLRELVEVSLSMAVAVVPEGLPAVITVTLAIGTQRMVRRQALIRRLPAVETLGSVNVICSDKTGTLTQNKMVVQAVATASGEFAVSGDGYSPVGEFQLDGEVIYPAQFSELQALAIASVLCNDASLNWEEESPSVLGDPTEGALLALGAKAGLEQSKLKQHFQRLGESPFSSERKRMSVVCQSATDDLPASRQAYVMFMKGSPEVVLNRCQAYQYGDRDFSLSLDLHQDILDTNEAMAARGLRVLGIAYKPLSRVPSRGAIEDEENNLIWLGLVGMLDAARPEVKDAVERCLGAGIRPVMITGDHPTTARAIAEYLGICQPGGTVLTGQQLAKMEESDFKTAVVSTSVYARVAPEHKLRIVKALQASGKFVGMTGDGVNDAPALKQADIGIAMGITGTDVSKEASDMILLDDNFASIVAATEEGRVVYDNIRRFIKYILGSNLGEVITIAAAPLLGLPEVPLTPLQILWMNLVTDGLPALALAVEPAAPDVMRRPPSHPQESIFARGLGWYIVRIGIVFALFTIALMVWAHDNDSQSWQTMVFTTLCIAQMGHAIAVRSPRLTLELNPLSNPYLWVAVTVTTLLQLALVYVPFLRVFFGTDFLNLWQLLVCLGFSSLIFVWVELEKLFVRWYRTK